MTAQRRAVVWRPELLSVAAGDAWRVLMLQQLCYWTSRTKDPAGWIYKTAADLLVELGAESELQPRAIQRKLAQLVEVGALEVSDGPDPFRRTKRYRPNREISAIDWAIEASRGPSSIVAAHRSVKNDASERQTERVEAHQMSPRGAPDDAPSVNQSASLQRCNTEMTNRDDIAGSKPADVAFVEVAENVALVAEAFSAVGKSTTETLCSELLKAAAQIPDAVGYLRNAIVDLGKRNPNASPAGLVRMAVEDIDTGKHFAWAASRQVVGARIAADPATYEADERTDAEVEAEAGELVGQWVEHLRETNGHCLDTVAKFEGYNDPEQWLRDAALLELRDNLNPPGTV